LGDSTQPGSRATAGRETIFLYFFGCSGYKKGDLSKFIEEAVRWRVFHRIVQDIKARNAKANPEELQRIIGEAVREVRKKLRTNKKADSA
jgi:hypothetical protein